MGKYELLHVARSVYGRVTGCRDRAIHPKEVEATAEVASEWICSLLLSDKPCMIARFGTVELNEILNVRSIYDGHHRILDYIMHKDVAWWWNEEFRYQVSNNAGFFPPTDEMLIKYKDRMLNDMRELDILGVFHTGTKYLDKELTGVKKVHLKDLEPFHADPPWTRLLKGKKVLVVHPLAYTIKKQYEEKRELLFKEKEILPYFHLEVIPAVQSLGGRNDKFENWFDALKWMEDEIDKHEYDVCLIGCGAYGFCLAAHCKRMGKKGFHLGGIIQFLFGIIGNRWEDPNYAVNEWGMPVGFYSNMINEYWVRPDSKDVPENANNVENACYW